MDQKVAFQSRNPAINKTPAGHPLGQGIAGIF
jgi:hypothetical protein